MGGSPLGDIAAYNKTNAGAAIITRKQGGDHGYGLKNIHRAVEKYNGHMDIIAVPFKIKPQTVLKLR